jgi:hypothetical protein
MKESEKQTYSKNHLGFYVLFINFILCSNLFRGYKGLSAGPFAFFLAEVLIADSVLSILD